MNCHQWVVDAVLYEPTPSHWKAGDRSQVSGVRKLAPKGVS